MPTYALPLEGGIAGESREEAQATSSHVKT